jgi:para-aminobenzoate synthetase component 1
MKNRLNQLGKQKKPFLFVIDFDVQHFYVAPLEQLDKQIFFEIDGFSNINTFVKKNTFHLKKKSHPFC